MIREVSVIIPCGAGHERLLPEAVASCLAASPAPEHIIVIDDFCPVAVPGQSGTLHYRLEQHRGRSYARNIGAKLAQTPWLYFLDADDFLEPTAIGDFGKHLQSGALDLLYGDYDYLDGKGQRQNVKKRAFSRKDGICYNAVNIGLFVRRDRFWAVGGFDDDIAIGEYWDLFLRYAINPRIKVVKNERPLFCARGSSSVWPEPGKLMERATAKIQAMIRGNYYRGYMAI